MYTNNKHESIMNELKKKGRSLSIKRTPISTETPSEVVQSSASPQPTVSATGGIHLASAETESDPFRKSLFDAGYSILEENEYGAVVRMEKGKPTFVPKTKKGFDPNENTVRNTVVLPEHIDIAMKVYAAKNRMSATQYITQLIVADLRIKENL